MHSNSSTCHIPEWKIQGDFSIGKDLAHSLLENSKSIKPSLLRIYSLCWKHPENLLQHRKLPLQKWFKAVSLRVGLFPATKAGEIAGTWSKFYWSQSKDPYMSPCASMLGWVEEKLFSLQVIAEKKFCLDENKPGRNSSVDLSLKISGCNNKRCLWTKLGALPTLQETDGCTASPLSGRLPASPVTQFPHHGKLWGQASTKGTAWGLLEDINAAHCGEYYYLHLDLIAQCVYTIVHMHMWLPWWQLYSDMKWP